MYNNIFVTVSDSIKYILGSHFHDFHIAYDDWSLHGYGANILPVTIQVP